MSNKSRQNLLQKIVVEQTIQKIAQEATETVKEETVDGAKVADDIFKKIMDSISIEELERESGS